MSDTFCLRIKHTHTSIQTSNESNHPPDVLKHMSNRILIKCFIIIGIYIVNSNIAKKY